MRSSLLLFVASLVSVIIVLYLGFSETVHINNLTIFVGLSSPMIALVVGLFVLRHLRSDLRILLALIAATVVVEGLSMYLAVNRQSNYWVLHIFTLVEFSLLVLVIYQWQTHERVRKFLWISVPVFFGIWLLNKLLLPLTDAFKPQLDSIVITIESIYLVAMGVFLLVDLLRDTTTSLFRHPRFWFASSLLIYFAGNLLIFALGNVLLDEKSNIPVIAWSILNALNVLRNFCYAGAFICQSRLPSFSP